MHLFLCILLVPLITSEQYANGMNVSITVLSRTETKSPLVSLGPSKEDGKTLILNRKKRDAFDSTTLKWVYFQGSIPSGAVSFWNSYAKRIEYPCKVSSCHAGFYNPSRGSACFYPYGDKELQSSYFSLLVNENDLEWLQWQRDSWGDVPSNSVGTCPGGNIYVGRNKYGIGKVDRHNRAFFIGYNGKEWWYKYYDVLIVKKNYRSQKIENVRYKRDQATYSNEDITLVFSKVTNYGCGTVKKSTTLSKAVTFEYRWDISSSVSVSVSTKMTAGIPGVFGAEWSISAEHTFGWSKGSTQSRSTTITETVEVSVPPNQICELSMEGKRMKANIPFTARVTRYYNDGTERSATVQGVSRNVVVAQVHVIVKRCQPILNAPPCRFM
ncbi:natterin-3-like [Hemicordylus capensis]|uniref:natterin-3-like n=1 Tax=Hemicordylus capensis TaxID=884348 RepID=UPI002303F50F|nr:natterin-3-like [Hemicordylus capensis]